MNTINKYLQFDDPTITSFTINVNEEFDLDDNFEELDIKTIVEMPPELEINFNEPVPVYLNIFINPDDEKAPYEIDARITSMFTVSNDISETETLQILQTDVATILLSYLRPMVSMMTATSGFPAMTLPMLDFSDSDD